MAICALMFVFLRGKVNVKPCQVSFPSLRSHLCFCRVASALSLTDSTDRANSHLSSCLLMFALIVCAFGSAWSEMGCLLSFGKL